MDDNASRGTFVSGAVLSSIRKVSRSKFAGQGEGSCGEPVCTAAGIATSLSNSRLLSAIWLAIARTISTSGSPNACGEGENTCRTPHTRPSSISGAMSIDRTSRRRQSSAFTRGSSSQSLQCCTVPVIRQAPANPEEVSTRTPRSGAFAPTVARQTISLFRSRATAAPVAPVSSRAYSTSS